MSAGNTRRRPLLAGLGRVGLGVALAAAVLASSAHADAVRDWNRHASDALINAPAAAVPGAGQTPPVAVQHMAIVQGAVYDAVNAIDGGHEPYLSGLPSAPSSASQRAAAITAAHHTLVGLLPQFGLKPEVASAVSQRLDDLYAASLSDIAAGDAKEQGIAAGAGAAHAMLELRTGDGRFETFTFSTGLGPGQWRPTAGINDPFAWVARVRPFAVDSASQFRTEGPLPLASKAYAAEYQEVKTLGARSSSSRTREQTALATFYTVNPVELWNRTYRTIAGGQGLGLAEEARLYAMANMAGADALITCWVDKEHWGFWRPVTAIRHEPDDGNPATVADSTWVSLAGSPPYPEHPSGYNCVTAGFMQAGREYFGPHQLAFGVHNTTTGVTRHYERFADVIQDVIDARVYLGIHFRTADVQGAWIGKKVAQWVDRHYFQPVGGG